jgi:hypothetical protein
MLGALRESLASLKNLAAQEEGAGDLPLYSNYAMRDTPLEQVYGANLGRLKEIKARVDPENVMGLAGGWKF